MKKLDQQDKIYLLLALFIGALLAANFLGAKITAFAVPAALAIFLNAIFWPIIFVVNLAASPLPDYQIINNPFLAYNFFNTIHVSVGILTVPVMFLITDIIEEVMGKKTAQKIILELKVGSRFKKENIDQIYSYLVQNDKKLGLLINFSREGVKIKRIVNIR